MSRDTFVVPPALERFKWSLDVPPPDLRRRTWGMVWLMITYKAWAFVGIIIAWPLVIRLAILGYSPAGHNGGNFTLLAVVLALGMAGLVWNWIVIGKEVDQEIGYTIYPIKYKKPDNRQLEQFIYRGMVDFYLAVRFGQWAFGGCDAGPPRARHPLSVVRPRRRPLCRGFNYDAVCRYEFEFNTRKGLLYELISLTKTVMTLRAQCNAGEQVLRKWLDDNPDVENDIRAVVTLLAEAAAQAQPELVREKAEYEAQQAKWKADCKRREEETRRAREEWEAAAPARAAAAAEEIARQEEMSRRVLHASRVRLYDDLCRSYERLQSVEAVLSGKGPLGQLDEVRQQLREMMSLIQEVHRTIHHVQQ